ncbi:unnamed protein product, partial [Ectocarpus fasciculatus]
CAVHTSSPPSSLTLLFLSLSFKRPPLALPREPTLSRCPSPAATTDRSGSLLCSHSREEVQSLPSV